MQIKEFILPRLPMAKDTGFVHKSVGNNCYSEYDVHKIEFDGLHCSKLDFIAKFIVQNKESFQMLILKNVTIESTGMALTNVLKDKVHKLDLNVIHLENVNLSQ